MRTSFLAVAIGDLQNSIRKESSRDFQGTCLARVFSRVICLVDLLELPLVWEMSRKYPLTHCAYCKKRPCACPERRQSATLLEQPEIEQLSWSLQEWQEGLDTLYGERNRVKGIENTLNRLTKELIEVIALNFEIRYGSKQGKLGDVLREITLEVSDVFAWTLAVANVLGIQVEPIMIYRYGTACLTCHGRPCGCPHFVFTPLEEESAHTTFGG